MWYNFWDMHSGGGQKTKWDQIYVEADSEAEAAEIFQKTVSRDPYNVTCDCCGDDYAICQHKSLEEASAYHRKFFRRDPNGNKMLNGVTPLEDWLADDKNTSLIVAKDPSSLIGYKKHG